MQRKVLMLSVFLFGALVFSAIFPYPIFSNYTNVTSKDMHIINSYQETELKNQSQNQTTLLNLNFEQINSLLPIDSTFQIYDFEEDDFYNAKRIGGNGHFDIIFVDLSTNILQNFDKNYKPVLVKFNEYCFAPASLNTYAHGFSDSGSQNLGHFCLHFKNSTLDNSNQQDSYHQKTIKKAQKLYKKFARQ